MRNGEDEPVSAAAALPAPRSPCIDVCRLDRHDRCVGCGRTLDEIARWTCMSAAEQWSVIDRLALQRVAP